MSTGPSPMRHLFTLGAHLVHNRKPGNMHFYSLSHWRGNSFQVELRLREVVNSEIKFIRSVCWLGTPNRKPWSHRSGKQSVGQEYVPTKSRYQKQGLRRALHGLAIQRMWIHSSNQQLLTCQNHRPTEAVWMCVWTHTHTERHTHGYTCTNTHLTPCNHGRLIVPN